LKTLVRFLKVTLVGGLLAVLPLGAQALLPKRRSQPKSDTFWTESVIAMKTVKSSDEKFTRHGRKPLDKACDTGWYPNFTSEGHAVRMARTKTVNC
jgi:hypothetical protein